MTFKKLGRIFCAAALIGAAATIPFMTGCNTDHPEATIKIEYNGVDYELNYRLYRNMYPQTVQHFIELADNNFYQDMIVHNYSSTYLYTGGYRYIENEEFSYSKAVEDGADDLLDYMIEASKEAEYDTLADPDAGKITPSVYHDFIQGEYNRPLNTLIGEFSNNQHKILNGALKSSFGCLRMYYTSKSDVKTQVYLDKQGSAKGVKGGYTYNSATSIFSIQGGSSTSSDSSYCIFATLKNPDELTELRKAINQNTSTTSVKMYVDNYDEFLGANKNTADYTLQRKPIIVRSVEITKY